MKQLLLWCLVPPFPDLLIDPGSGLYEKNESDVSKFKRWKRWKEAGKENLQKLATGKEGLVQVVKGYISATSSVNWVILFSKSGSCTSLHVACDLFSSSVGKLEAYGIPTDIAYCLSTRMLEVYFRPCSKV